MVNALGSGFRKANNQPLLHPPINRKLHYP